MTGMSQKSDDARFLIQELKKIDIGETVGYEALAKAIGRSREELSSPLQTARRALLEDDRRVFDTVRNVGLKRMSDVDIVGTSAATASRIRRAARRGAMTLAAVSDFSALSRENQMRHSAAMSMLAAVAEMSTEKGIGKIESRLAASDRELPIAQTLDAFKSVGES